MRYTNQTCQREIKTKYKRTKNPYKVVEVFNTNGENIKDTLEKIFKAYSKEEIKKTLK